MAKAGRPKKGSSGLPWWFDMQEYAPVKDFVAAKDWWQQLEFRKHLFDAYKECRRSPDKNYFEGPEDREMVPLMRVLIGPIKAIQTLRKNELASYNERIFRQRGVRDILNEEIMLLFRAFPENIRNYVIGKKVKFFDAFGLWAMTQRMSNSKKMELHRFFCKPLQKSQRLYLSVDMSSYPDEVLLNEFIELLHEKRQIWGEVKSPFYGTRDFDDWYKCGILPYLDLKLWEMVTSESFHWPTFTEELKNLTGLCYGGESTHAKAVKACQKLLMDERTLKILQSQAAREESGKIKKSKKLSLHHNSEKKTRAKIPDISPPIRIPE